MLQLHFQLSATCSDSNRVKTHNNLKKKKGDNYLVNWGETFEYLIGIGPKAVRKYM